MKTTVASALAAIALSTCASALATTASAGQGSRTTPRGPDAPATPVDPAAYAEAVVAQAKVNLRLTPEQEGDWPRFGAALRAYLEADTKGLGAAGTGGETTVDRLRRRADRLGARARSGAELADALAPLYGKLDGTQRGRIDRVVERRPPDPCGPREGRPTPPPDGMAPPPEGAPLPPPTKGDP